jgi:Putative polyhydroxyalkanoic acid system protein (PHA_gran_rgn)
MPKLSIAVPHSLSQQEATERLKGLLAKVMEKYKSQMSNVEEQWNDNALAFGFSTYGFPIKGTVDVGASEVTLDGDLPFAAMMFKGKIEQGVRDELEKVLA